jgi:DNA invertase Pin-like site-specific DNA recombinase
MIPAIVYAAKSTDDKHNSIGGKGNGERGQIDDCRELAAKRSWEVVGEYKDEAKSAFHGSRGDGLAAAMEHCERLAAESKTANVALIVQHSDRLARGNIKDAKHLIEYGVWAIKKGVTIASVQDPDTFADLHGQQYALLKPYLTGERNYEDSRRKGEAVRGGLKRSAARGRSRGGPRPYGYRREFRLNEKNEKEGFYVVDEVEAAVIRRVFDEYLHGRGHRVIAAGLAADSAPTVNGGPWRQKMVATILSRKLYLGIVTDVDGKEFPGEHEAIITREVFDEAQRIRRSQARQTGGRPASGLHLLTKGILKCGACGHTMYPRHHARSGHDYYYCGGRLEYGREFCGTASLRRDEADEALMRELAREYIDLDGARSQLEERHALNVALAREQARSADQELIRAEARLARVVRDYQDGFLEREDYAAQRRDLLAELDAARGAVERAHTHHEAVKAGEDPDAELRQQMADVQRVAEIVAGATDLNARRAVVHQLFVKVTYHPPGSPLLDTDDPGEQEIIRASERVAGGVIIPWLRPENMLNRLLGKRVLLPAGGEEKLPPTS